MALGPVAWDDPRVLASPIPAITRDYLLAVARLERGLPARGSGPRRKPAAIVWLEESVEWEQADGSRSSATIVRAVHPDGVDHVFIDKQCSCGLLNIGVVGPREEQPWS